MPLTSFRLPDELHDRIKRLANKQGKTLSAMIKEILAGYIDKDSTETRLTVLEKRVTELEKKISKK